MRKLSVNQMQYQTVLARKKDQGKKYIERCTCGHLYTARTFHLMDGTIHVKKSCSACLANQKAADKALAFWRNRK